MKINRKKQCCRNCFFLSKTEYLSDHDERQDPIRIPQPSIPLTTEERSRIHALVRKNANLEGRIECSQNVWNEEQNNYSKNEYVIDNIDKVINRNRKGKCYFLDYEVPTLEGMRREEGEKLVNRSNDSREKWKWLFIAAFSGASVNAVVQLIMEFLSGDR